MNIIEDIYSWEEVHLLMKYVPYQDIKIEDDDGYYDPDIDFDEEDFNNGYIRYYMVYDPKTKPISVSNFKGSWGEYVAQAFIIENQLRPEFLAIREFVLNCNFENLPLHINHPFIAPYAKWRLELRR